MIERANQAEGAPILVTGGGGFLGSAIVRLLRERGEIVRSLSRTPHAALDEWGPSRSGDDDDLRRFYQPSRAARRCSMWPRRRGSGGPFRYTTGSM